MARIDTDLLGLQIVALDNAMVVGEVDGLLIDDAAVKVAGFLVDLGLYEASVLPFGSAHAVGLDAVVVESASKITPISASPALEALAEKDVTISDAKAITRSGRTVGTIGDFFIDTVTGDVVGMEFIAADQTVYPREAAVIPASTLYRLGRDIVVLEDDYDKHLMKDDASLERISKPRAVDTAPVAAPEPVEEAPVDESPVAEEPPAEDLVAAEEEPVAAEESAVAAEEPVAAESASLVPDAPEPAKEIEDAFEAITLPEEPETADEPVDEPPVVAAEPADERDDEPAVEAPADESAAEDDALSAEQEPMELEAGADETADDTLTSAPVLDLAEPEAIEPAATAPTEPEPADDAFTSQQKHFLIGKRVLRRIETPGGEIIAEEGESVTFAMIQKAKSSDQLLILSLNVE
ncbi:MAG: PRC-barrel domain-containing protein [Thermoleophilia bacterium]